MNSNAEDKNEYRDSLMKWLETEEEKAIHPTPDSWLNGIDYIPAITGWFSKIKELVDETPPRRKVDTIIIAETEDGTVVRVDYVFKDEKDSNDDEISLRITTV